MARSRPPSGKAPDPYDRALRLLARREHSRRELMRKLQVRGVGQEAAQETLDRLAGNRYQDDARFAESLVRQRINQGYGPKAIQAELRSHGIRSGEGWEALKSEDWQAHARRLVQRRMPQDGADATQRRKIALFLLRRGFSGETVRVVLGLAVDEAD